MCFRKGINVLVTAGALGLLGACNQLDIVLPSIGTYQVNALINHTSLDKYSIIAAEDTVLPYFSNSVAGDPDLVNLVVYLEDSKGKPAGSRVYYTTEAVPVERSGKTEYAGAVSESGAETSGTETSGAETDTGGGEAEETGALVQDSAAVHDLMIPVDSFAGQLPPFPLPRNLEIGYYTMVFEIRGRQDLLSRSSRQIYYIGNQKFENGGIRYYLPGLYGNSHLVPQGLKVLLETQVEYGEGLEPYIVWYNGNRRIGEGFAKDGAARLLWKAPQQTGFHTIRTELFPLMPQAAMKGRIAELSLPVSAGTDENAASLLQNGYFLYRYQLAGDLQEAGTGAELGGTKAPLWYPAKQIYGLALNAGDYYEAPLGVLNPAGDSSGDGGGFFRFFIRLSPLSEGPVFGARLGNTAYSVVIGLSLKEDALYLELEDQDEKIQAASLEINGAEGSFTGVLIDVEIRETGLGVYLETADSPYSAPGHELGLFLDAPLQGELHSWLGKRETSKVNDPADPVTHSGSEYEGGQSGSPAVAGPVAVIDDFTALFCRVVETGEGQFPPQVTGENPPAPEEAAPANS
ncbi:MAG: hypothetical protein LBL56_02865 [Treponema sp.]|nr:hypothetical protein [Treponema sp.]